MSSSDSKEWQRAVDKELSSIKKNEVWTLVDRPWSRKEPGKANVLDSKWVFKRKTGKNDYLTRKARSSTKYAVDTRNFFSMDMQIVSGKTKGIIEINQSGYTQKILERFIMRYCNVRSIPMDTLIEARKRIRKGLQALNAAKQKISYREAIGSLFCLAGATRPDISYAVSILAKC